MKIGFAPSLSVELIQHSSTIMAMENDLNNSIGGKNYGDDIAEIYIGIVSVHPQFAQFFEPRPPKYTKGRKSYVKEDVHYTLNNSFEFDVHVDFENFKNASEFEAQKLVAQGLLDSLDVFKRFKKFDHDQFKADVKELFKSKGWIA